MRKPVIWTGAAAAIVLAACSRAAEFAFGKAIAFTYAVIVSLVANAALDFVRDPPPAAAPAAARALLPVAARLAAAKTAPADVPPDVPPAAAPRQGDGAPPGPGSGGLY